MRAVQESCCSDKVFLTVRGKTQITRKHDKRWSIIDVSLLNFVLGERAAVHRLLYNTATLKRIHRRRSRPTTACWKPNYRDCIGMYRRIDKTVKTQTAINVYIPHKELSLCCFLTVSGLTHGLPQTRVHTAAQRCPKKKSYKNYLYSTPIAPKLRLRLDRRFFVS